MTPTDAPTPPRYAIYVRPAEDDLLTLRADRWLGRSPAGADVPDAPPMNGLAPERWRAWVASPRTYGFHGTLKPPFRLAEGRSRAELEEALAGFAATCAAFAVGPLDIRRIGRFLALAAGNGDGSIGALAACCVEAFDRFRGQPTEAELARRRAHPLSDRQEALLERWGYPYAMDEFRFHMTLTGALPPDELAAAEGRLAAYFDGFLDRPMPVTDLCLFEQSAPGAPFRVVCRYPLSVKM